MVGKPRQKDSQTLTRKGWRAVGGVLGALGAHAEQLYVSLPLELQGVSRKILFLALVSSRGDRRDQSREALEALCGDPTAVGKVLETFERGDFC